MSCCCCFPPTAKVLTTAGYVHIVDLKPWHKLLTVKGMGVAVVAVAPNGITETSFCTYLHFDPNMVAEFLVLICDNGAELVISANHLLFKAGSGEHAAAAAAVPAKDIAIGDSLVFVDVVDWNGEARKVTRTQPKVTRIETRTIQGVYAPLSGKGTLIVDGFHASCYAEVESHTLAHAATAPLRAWCRKIGTKRSPKVEGIHGYAKLLAAIRGIKISDSDR